ncbi:hypothetical protein FGIG_12568 [Fasciola gigantica]|uniref:Uncharacterized protein n=1 Tax=Fasciola gigantica TaxID=46835 RepID=A0A504YGM5_FASGI|nr:hypothetical protein FGIG_12568 [Fasciola gigantica]
MKQKLTEHINNELSGLDRYIRPLGPLIAKCEVATRFASAIHRHGRPEEILLCSKQIVQQLSTLERQKFEQLKAQIHPEFIPGEHQLTNDEVRMGELGRDFHFGKLNINQEWEPGIEPAPPSRPSKKESEVIDETNVSNKNGYVSTGVNTSPRKPFTQSHRALDEGNGMWEADEVTPE